MSYKVTQEIKAKARAIGVTVKPSTRTNKKLDVYDKNGDFIASIGDIRYADYHIYKAERGEAYANEKRKQYKARHEKNRNVKYRDGKLTAGYLADHILW